MSPTPDRNRRIAIDRAVLEVGLAGDATAPPPPLAVADALAARAPGAWAGFAPDDVISATESYRRAVAAFDREAATLDLAGWASGVATYGTAHDLVAHLIAIERYVGAQLSLWPAETATASLDHVALSRPTIEAWREQPFGFALAEWRRITDAIVAALEREPERLPRPAEWHGAAMSVADLLVIRTFELWTHADDLRRARGNEVSAPDNAQLRLMTALAAEVLPLALEVAGRARPDATVRLVLTGRGGGTWRRPAALGGTVRDDDDVLIVADAIGFCRLTANRLSAAELGAYIEGDQSLGAAVLAAMPALAVD